MLDSADVRLLLIEDNELDRRVLLRHLADFPDARFDVTTVGGLNEGLQALADGSFDCVLLDLSLPDSAGLAAIDRLLDQPGDAPVVVLTGLDDPTVAVEAVDRGAQDYLTKHRIDPEVLGRSIRYAIARHHGDTQLRSAQDLLRVMHERERIARDLHDTVIQQMFATGMGLQAVSGRVDDPEVRQRLETAVSEIDVGIRQLRETIYRLHSEQPEVTVGDEISQLADGAADRLGFRPTVRLGPGIDAIDEAVRRELLATLNEALSNVAKHANATAVQIIVEVEDDGRLGLRVVDNGRGMEATGGAASVDRLSGRGIRNMEARARALAGDLQLGAAPGGGTELVWLVDVLR